MTLTELCKELNNYFVQDITFGVFAIENNTLVLDSLRNGQYFRIVGSTFNDGVYQYPTTELTDETFDGAIWAMAVPRAVIALCEGITDWEAEYAKALKSPYSSESFGGYSYTKAGSGNGQGQGGTSWQGIFSNELSKWRKIRP